MITSPSQQTPPSPSYALVADRLVKRYDRGAVTALDGFSLTIAPGDFFGLLGPNGAGKTTALSLFSTLFAADSGSIRILGADLKTEAAAIRPLIGLVPQELALYEKFSGRENLAFFGRLYGLGGTKLRQRIDYCLQVAGLHDHHSRPVSGYSGGMKRRLNLAVGLLHMPDLLLLDEPTVGIDAQSRHLIHEQLLSLNRKGMTIVYSTHYMEEAQDLCSRIAIVDRGRVVEEGIPSKLLAEHGSRNLEHLFLGLTGRQLRDT